MKTPNEFYCDPKTGLCTVTVSSSDETASIPQQDNTEIIYIGDPMCSWCWGISPALHQLAHQGQTLGIPFRLVVGGLRPGGGDAWDDKFKGFLKHHWEEVNKHSGQPFGYNLFDRAHFNYDTEPTCRAVVTARKMDRSKEHQFYTLVHHHFYVQNQDPTTTTFYQPICEALDLSFEEFQTLFESDEMKQLTQNDFDLSRSWGIRSFPTVVLRVSDQLHPLAIGFSSFEDMWERAMHVIG